MMYKAIICLFLSLYSIYSYGQELIITQKIDKDSISIKWLPNNFEQYQKIALEGAQIVRIAASKNSTYEQLDFSQGKKWTIAPAKERFDQLDSKNPKEEKQIALLETVYENNLPETLLDFSFASALSENVINPDFQFVLGNIFVDKSYSKKETYVYRITVDGFEACYVFIDPKTETSYPGIADVSLSLDKKKVAELIWNKKTYENLALGYDIEHSMDKEKDGAFLDTLPFIPFSSEQQIDRTQARYRHNPEPGHFHYYRIHGIDLFGHRSLLSERQKIYVPLLIDAWTEIDTLYASDETRIIKGSIHPNTDKPNIKEILLVRSSERDGLYSELKSLTYSDSVVRFSITENETGDHYYYKIALTNKDDSVFSAPRYLFTLDQKPPNPPTQLEGKIDSSGIVKLTWTAPEDDDIKGYRVYRANQIREEFIEITSQFVTEMIFTDTLALDNLSSEVYYCMSATDLNYNKSIMSDTILVLKPDTIAPIPCILKDVQIKDTVLKVIWINSDSEDIGNNFLLRKTGVNIDTVFQWTGTQTEFNDETIDAGNNYTYVIVTADKSKNIASSKEFTRFYEPGFRKPLTNFTADANMDEKSIVLSWDRPKDEVYSYQIFRTKEGGKLRQLKTISDAAVTSLKDKNVSINNKYIYSVKYINQDGIHSIPAKGSVIYQ